VAVVRTENLTKIYGQRHIALNGVDLVVPKGAIFGFLGPNGAGKTTTLRLILGLQRPTAGRVYVFDEPVGPNSSEVRQRIGYLPTNPEFPPDMTPITYLDFAGQLCRLSREQRSPRLAALIRAVGLLGAQDRRIGAFSTGMRTRLGIAASLMNDPELVIWDEPCSGLDPAGRRHTMDLIRWMGKTKTVIVSSHILSDIDQVCTDVGVLSDGQLIFLGEMSEMKRLIRVEDLTVEIVGEDGAAERFEAALKGFAAVESIAREGRRFTVRLVEGAPLGPTLGETLARAGAVGAEVLAVSSGWGRMEDAYLKMLEADDSLGFVRAYGREGGGADAPVPSAPAS
jgi:ABC-2 type transport system ATP-binding protein